MKKKAALKTKKPTSNLRWHDPAFEKLHAFLAQQKNKIAEPLPAHGPDEDAFWDEKPTCVSDDPQYTHIVATDEGYPAFESFVGEIRQLFGKSVSKGYGPMQPDDPNQLYAFMQEFFSDDHALGEIVYKAIRYKNKRNPEDLVKIAGWAWLVFMHHWRKEAERGN